MDVPHRVLVSLHQLAVPDLVESVTGADVLIFVVPHQFILRVCDTIKDHIKKDAMGMSLIKVTFLLSPPLGLWFYIFILQCSNVLCVCVIVIYIIK